MDGGGSLSLYLSIEAHKTKKKVNQGSGYHMCWARVYNRVRRIKEEKSRWPSFWKLFYEEHKTSFPS